MFIDFLILFLFIVLLIKTIVNKNGKRKKIFNIVLGSLLIISYIILELGFSTSAKLTYYNRNYFITDYKYVLDYDTTDGKTIVMSKKEPGNSFAQYNLSVYNKCLGLYFVNYEDYTNGVIYGFDNEDSDIIYKEVNDKYYYLINFELNNIETLEINETTFTKGEELYYIFESDEKIYNLKINNNDVDWYDLILPDSLYNR